MEPGGKRVGINSLPEGICVVLGRALCWDVHQGMARPSMVDAGSAGADINININMICVSEQKVDPQPVSVCFLTSPALNIILVFKR